MPSAAVHELGLSC